MGNSETVDVCDKTYCDRIPEQSLIQITLEGLPYKGTSPFLLYSSRSSRGTTWMLCPNFWTQMVGSETWGWLITLDSPTCCAGLHSAFLTTVLYHSPSDNLLLAENIKPVGYWMLNVITYWIEIIWVNLSCIRSRDPIDLCPGFYHNVPLSERCRAGATNHINIISMVHSL